MRWRKATWAIIIWTALVALWVFDALGGPAPASEGFGIFAVVLNVLVLIFLWFIGLIILAIYWFVSRPKHNTTVYGPQGQQIVVTQKEAKKWVEVEGWTYQPLQPYAGQQPSQQRGPRPGGQPPQGGAVAWLRNRPRGGAAGPPTPSDVRRVTGSDADAVLAEAAATVAEKKPHGKSLVEAAWMSKQRSGADDTLLLNVAFGESGVRYWALWPDGEDAMEAVLARVPAIDEQDRPK